MFVSEQLFLVNSAVRHCISIYLGSERVNSLINIQDKYKQKQIYNIPYKNIITYGPLIVACFELKYDMLAIKNTT